MDGISDAEIAPAMAAGTGKRTSKRRLPSARVVMWPVSAPSTTRKASIFLPAAANLQRWRIPSRLPSPSSPTLAASSNPRGKSGRFGPLFQAWATASSDARPAPLSETPGPRKAPSAPMEISSLLRGAMTVSRCAVSATYGAVARRWRAHCRRGQWWRSSRIAELCLKPGGAFLLEKRRRRDTAQRQMSLVNPLLFARKPLQTLANRPMASQLFEVRAGGGINGHAQVV